jgi:uncharacterized membrane protein YhaH (DUF805 family)
VNWFLDPITKKYAKFDGRATRQEYWMFYLTSIIAGFVVGIVLGVLGAILRSPSLITVVTLLFVLYAAAIVIPSLALSVRRLHDTGRSGWWLLISFVPFGGLLLLLFYIIDSQPGDNQYGPNPKGVQASVARSM